MTKTPLKYISTEYIPMPNSKEDTKTVITNLTPENSNAWGKIFHNRAWRTKFSVQLFIEHDPIKPEITKVILLGTDTDIRTEYFFKWEGCWFLTEIHDSTL
jgi:hypothetical protein